MIHAITRTLAEWHGDPLVHAVVIESTSPRSFCAGGDIRAIRALALAGDTAGVEAFFADEYGLNRAIARYPKPVVALIDGICMGGGIGLSVHGAARVAAPGALFAMPETGIGLFPDVGATFLLPRLRDPYGMYMALTGARIPGPAAAWLGLATHLVPSLDGLADAIAQDGIAVLAAAATPPPPAPLAGIEAFAADTLPAIIAALEAQGTDWSATQLATLRGVSPSALAWTFEAMRRGARQTLEQCQAMELHLTRAATIHPDFAEGVRAMVVDKDRKPRWSPATLDGVDHAAIQAMFA